MNYQLAWVEQEKPFSIVFSDVTENAMRAMARGLVMNDYITEVTLVAITAEEVNFDNEMVSNDSE